MDDDGQIKIEPTRKIKYAMKDLAFYKKVKAIMKELLTVRRISNLVIDRESKKNEILYN